MITILQNVTKRTTLNTAYLSLPIKWDILLKVHHESCLNRTFYIQGWTYKASVHSGTFCTLWQHGNISIFWSHGNNKLTWAWRAKTYIIILNFKIFSAQKIKHWYWEHQSNTSDNENHSLGVTFEQLWLEILFFTFRQQLLV